MAEPMQITLVDEDAIEFVRSKVRSGEYASEADVLREGVLVLRQDAADLERWIKEVIVPRCEALEADPTSCLTVEQVETNLAERRRRRAAVCA